jgi:hypothetical protein
MTLSDCGWWFEHQLPTVTGEIGPSEELGFVFQVSTAFTAIGLAVAWYRRRQDPKVDTFVITTSWTLLGTLAGLLVVALELLLG